MGSQRDSIPPPIKAGALGYARSDAAQAGFLTNTCALAVTSCTEPPRGQKTPSCSCEVLPHADSGSVCTKNEISTIEREKLFPV